MPRLSTRETPLRETPPRAAGEISTAKRTRVRKGGGNRSVLDIPPEMIPDGIDLQWVTDSINGEPTPQMRAEFEINGWQPVEPDMWNGLFDGIFTKRGHKGEINYGGLVLMERPMELTIESRYEEAMARDHALMAQQNMIKGGVLPGFSPGFEPGHPSAVSKNVLTRSIKPPMDVPKD